MWRFIKYKIPESVVFYVAFHRQPFLSAKHMSAVVAVFNAVVGHVGEENVSDLIQSTPLKSEAWLSSFNIKPYSHTQLLE